MKKLTVIAMASLFAMSVASAAVAATPKCTVEAVEGTKVTLDCKECADKMKVGDEVKVKLPKEKAAVEGC
ncbi:MAG: hypothetical protein CSB32_00390 [Desulfobacterales bacterium]|nr:MAG: hypothetical protein CSB32_00390 [Desulfobacterales bacterium]